LMKAAFEFASRIAKFRPLLVVVYGSAARGEAGEGSDLDMLVVLERRDPRVEEEIGEAALDVTKEYGVDVDLIVTGPGMEGLDPKFLEEVLAEGVVLYGRKKCVDAGLKLEPHTIYTLRLSHLGRGDKARLERALYGRKTMKKARGKTYVSQVKGLLEEVGGRKLGPGVIIVPSHAEKQVEELLERFKAKYRKIRVWLSPV